VITESERITLREVEQADDHFILELLNDPDWIRFIGDRKVHTLADAREFIRTRFESAYKEHGIGLWLMVEKSTGKAIGICGLVNRQGLEDIDLGYALLPQYRGQGFAFEAANASLQYGNERLGLGRIVAITAPGNRSSCELLERLGFHYERRMVLPGEQEELLLYAKF
jgi:ribosomal-protein-alanine N-acetyltransferase